MQEKARPEIKDSRDAVVRGKTVQVVSNNNSAIVNVLEKLSKYDMGFIVALLGSTANKEKFIETQVH